MLRFITTWVLDICTSMLCSHIILSVLKSFSWSMCPLFSTDYGKWCLHSSKMQSVKRWPRYHISNLLQICTRGNVCCKLVNLLNNTLQFTWAQMSVIWMSLIAVLDADCGSADSFCGQEEVAGDSPCWHWCWPTTLRLWRFRRAHSFARCCSSKLATCNTMTFPLETCFSLFVQAPFAASLQKLPNGCQWHHHSSCIYWITYLLSVHKDIVINSLLVHALLRALIFTEEFSCTHFLTF